MKASSVPNRLVQSRKGQPHTKLKRNKKGVAVASESGSSNEDDDALKKEVENAAYSELQQYWQIEPAAVGAPGASGSPQESAGEEEEEKNSLRRKLQAAFAYLQDGLVERETEIRLMMLAALSGEHLLLLGPPGTAKSELGRRLSSMCRGTFFERLLTRFSVPEELFGPLSMRSLEEDKYERHIDGYLPSANVAFIDEVFKANSAILNALLTVLQERLFDNGSERVEVPLVCLIGASNELPESEELDALYDRFLLRYQVEQVSQANLQSLIAGTDGSASWQSASDSNTEAGSPLSIEDMQGVYQRAKDEVEVPDGVAQLIAGLREHLQEQCEPPVYVSDRRLVKAVSMLKVAAYTDGRTRVNEFDCLLLRHVLWQRPEEREYVQDYLLDRTVELKGSQQLRYLLGRLFSSACRAQSGFQTDKQLDTLVSDAESLCNALHAQLTELSDTESGGLTVLQEHLWLGPNEAARMSQSMGPRLRKAREELSELLEHAVMLKVALQKGVKTHVLALLLPQFWRAHVIDVRLFVFLPPVSFACCISSACSATTERCLHAISLAGKLRRCNTAARYASVICTNQVKNCVFLWLQYLIPSHRGYESISLSLSHPSKKKRRDDPEDNSKRLHSIWNRLGSSASAMALNAHARGNASTDATRAQTVQDHGEASQKRLCLPVNASGLCAFGAVLLHAAVATICHNMKRKKARANGSAQSAESQSNAHESHPVAKTVGHSSAGEWLMSNARANGALVMVDNDNFSNFVASMSERLHSNAIFALFGRPDNAPAASHEHRTSERLREQGRLAFFPSLTSKVLSPDDYPKRFARHMHCHSGVS